MIVVFLGFATDADPVIKMTGIGLASAVLVDVTLIRLVAAPAALSLLGPGIWGRAARATGPAVAAPQGRS
jgi:RND superfamily putative drug exporter